MRNLGSIEDGGAFMTAIADDADVNGSWKGDAIVKHLFIEVLRRITVASPVSAGVPTDPNVIKLDALVKSGADLTPIFENIEDEFYEFGNTVRLVSRRIELLRVILDSDQAEKITRMCPNHRRDLLKLYQFIAALMPVLGKMVDKNDAVRYNNITENK